MKKIVVLISVFLSSSAFASKLENECARQAQTIVNSVANTLWDFDKTGMVSEIVSKNEDGDIFGLGREYVFLFKYTEIRGPLGDSPLNPPVPAYKVTLKNKNIANRCDSIKLESLQ